MASAFTKHGIFSTSRSTRCEAVVFPTPLIPATIATLGIPSPPRVAPLSSILGDRPVFPHGATHAPADRAGPSRLDRRPRPRRRLAPVDGAEAGQRLARGRPPRQVPAGRPEGRL